MENFKTKAEVFFFAIVILGCGVYFFAAKFYLGNL